jgi:hypothetical protein
MRRWGKSRTEAFDCGFGIAEGGIKKGGEHRRGGIRRAEVGPVVVR